MTTRREYLLWRFMEPPVEREASVEHMLTRRGGVKIVHQMYYRRIDDGA
jgi:hypothetical protein